MFIIFYNLYARGGNKNSKLIFFGIESIFCKTEIEMLRQIIKLKEEGCDGIEVYVVKLGEKYSF
jgi:hypothetical protein